MFQLWIPYINSSWHLLLCWSPFYYCIHYFYDLSYSTKVWNVLTLQIWFVLMEKRRSFIGSQINEWWYGIGNKQREHWMCIDHWTLTIGTVPNGTCTFMGIAFIGMVPNGICTFIGIAFIGMVPNGICTFTGFGIAANKLRRAGETSMNEMKSTKSHPSVSYVLLFERSYHI